MKPHTYTHKVYESLSIHVIPHVFSCYQYYYCIVLFLNYFYGYICRKDMIIRQSDLFIRGYLCDTSSTYINKKLYNDHIPNLSSFFCGERLLDN